MMVMDKARTVAVVDDDERMLESLVNLFESAGFCVQAHRSGSLLMDAGVSSIDCLVTDIGMPGIDGFELCERVKRRRPRLPVFLISGRHEPGDESRLKHGCATEFFRKPFNGQRLLLAVEAALFNQGEGS